MRENQITRDRIETVRIRKIFADRVIRKMTRAAQHALLHHPRVRPHLQHIEIVIGFQNQAIRAAEMHFYELRHVTEVGDDRHFRAIRTEREPDGISRIVGYRECVNINVADAEMLPRVNCFHSVEPLAKGSWKNALHHVHSRFGDVERRFPQAEHLWQAVAVVGVFVSDEDAVEMFDGIFDGGEPRERFALAEPGVHDESRALRLE